MFHHDGIAPRTPAQRRLPGLISFAGTSLSCAAPWARCAALAAALSAGAAPALAQDTAPGREPPTSEETGAEAQPPEDPALTPPSIQPVNPALETEDGQDLTPDQPLPPGMFEFNFRDGVELTVLVDYVADYFDLQIVILDGTLLGEKVFLPTPITLPPDRVLYFLNQLLEQKGFTLTRGIGGVYMIQRLENVVAGSPGVDPFSVTRIIPTPGVRPSSLAPALAVVGIGGATGLPGQQPAGGRASGTSIAYLDDLGVILIAGSPRLTQNVEQLVNRLVSEQASISFQRIELRYVAAAYARERVLELIGAQQQRAVRQPIPGQPNVPQQQIPVPGSTAGTTLLNLEDRLTIDSQTNALIFRGRPDETTELTRLLAIVDAPSALVSKWYAVGRAVAAVASEGQRLALGSVVTEQGGIQDVNQAVRFQVPGFQQQSPQLIGTGFVVFPEVGGFVYRGTLAQHAQVERLINSLAELTSAEHVVVEFYKLRHSNAEEVAEIIQNLLSNQLSTASSPLLGRDQTRRDQLRQPIPPVPPPLPEGADPALAAAAPGAPGEIGAITASEDTFVLADEANNQVVVKAPKRLQDQFARLIDRLDLRRPQVFIDAKIVAVTSTDEFRLAFESQLIRGDFAVSTNFGLNEGFSEENFLSRKDVSTVLPNLTAAVINSNYVPLIIHALQENTDLRILSSPQLLVDDNEEATVVSVERQPFSQIIQPADGAPITSQGGESTAGTTLIVTPQISEGGYLRLTYEIELSSFIGDPTSAGLAPPSQENSISSESVTIPSDSTIVVGGLTVDTESRTVLKVPLLGDIPLLGHLFRDQGKSNRKTTLYVFITPTIMRDPNFDDLRLLTRGPASIAGIEPDLPPRRSVRIEILPPRARGAALPPPALQPAPVPPGPGPEPLPADEARDGWIAPSTPRRPSSTSSAADGRHDRAGRSG